MKCTKLLIFHTIVLIACLIITPSVFSDEPDKILHNKCLYPTVVIEQAVYVNGKFLKITQTGSGVIVRSEKMGDYFCNVVLTCEHVVSDDKLKAFTNHHLGRGVIPDIKHIIKYPIYKNWSEFERYDFYLSDEIKSIKSLDTAVLLFVSREKMPTVDFIDPETKIYIGSDTIKIGAGLGDSPRLDFGKITSINPFALPNMKGTLRHSAMTVPGDSGGPVFHDNKFIGITSFIRNMPRNLVFSMAYVRPISGLIKFSEDNDNCLDFVYKKEADMPALTFSILKWKRHKLNNPSNIEPNFWDKQINKKLYNLLMFGA